MSKIQTVQGTTTAPAEKKEDNKVWISKQKNEVETIMKELPNMYMRSEAKSTEPTSRRGSKILPVRSTQNEVSTRTTMDFVSDDNRYKWCTRLLSQS
ncbi:hypothetical protein GCK32_013240, partial [Trichostrongylus colubriformis]